MSMNKQIENLKSKGQRHKKTMLDKIKDELDNNLNERHFKELFRLMAFHRAEFKKTANMYNYLHYDKYNLQLERDTMRYEAYTDILKDPSKLDEIKGAITKELEKLKELIDFSENEIIKLNKQRQLTIDSLAKRGYNEQEILDKIDFKVDVIVSESDKVKYAD